jgi:curli biogenesis system outer membrane secretion channel CsgG
MTNRICLTAFVIASVFLGLTAPVHAKKEKEDLIPAYEPIVWPDYSGGKVGLGVLTFEDGLSDVPETTWLDADSGAQVHFGLGDGLSNMLVSTLLSTNRFTLIDKKIAKKIFELYSTDTAKKLYVSGTGLPKVPGIKYFILGSLTAFNDGERGAEGGVGFGGIKLTGGKKVASLMIHMRMIDATNGQVVYSKPVSGIAEVSKAGVSIAGFGEMSAFLASPLGQAVQKMLDKATDEIITTSFPGTPSVFEVAGGEAPSETPE